ncbi:hypothetical protein Mpal_2715 [Methanosphaerula palustris E1-9c]|uniref:Uncharacterized protein n=2 Tax=Methanosphaerula palustris TaxID=475088 RepID=B8GFU6_METPE|nr:hypothetical protein Mpal_2715 [Methanosphaerula palustris E1-9c]
MDDQDMIFEIDEKIEAESATKSTEGPSTGPSSPQITPSMEPVSARPPPPSVPAPQKRSVRSRWGWYLGLSLIGLVLITLIVAFISIGITIGGSEQAAHYPYTVTYDVTFPNSNPVQIGNILIVAIPYADHVSLSVDKVPYDIKVGEQKEITQKQAAVTILGYPLLSFSFKLDATYNGLVDSDASFSLGVRTSEQVPSAIIARLLPPSVNATPV